MQKKIQEKDALLPTRRLKMMLGQGANPWGESIRSPLPKPATVSELFKPRILELL